MASISLIGPPQFPTGTSVSAYPVSNWNGPVVKTAAPVGSSTETQTVTANVAAFVALASNTRYVAYALVGGVHTYKNFSTRTDPTTGGSGGGVIEDPRGNLGATATLDLSQTSEDIVILSGTLNANHVLTISNRRPCVVILDLVQDGTGSRTLTVSDGVTPQLLTIPTTAGAAVMVTIAIPNTSSMTVAVSGSGTTPDADASTKGKVQLAGDLTGTAASPAIAADAVTAAKIAAAIKPSGSAAAGTEALRALGTTTGTAAPGTGSRSGLFGDGTDGALLFDGTSTVTGCTRSGTTYTVTRDLHAASIQVNAGVTILTASYAILCQGAVNIAATAIVSNDGNNAASATAGTAGSSASYAGGSAGGNGTTTNGAAAVLTGAMIGSGLGGAGGLGSGGSAGAAGTATVTIPIQRAKIPQVAMVGLAQQAGATRVFAGGTGGGGGGGDTTNSGGGGGGAAGILTIFAGSITNAGTIRAKGGNGFTPLTGNCGGGGGGGGGCVMLFTLAAVTNTGTISTAGGTKGNGVGTGANGVDGAAGQSVQVVLV